MGTNFYVVSNVCDHCGRGESERHIGKSSAGWCFALRVYPEDGINDLDDWLPILAKARIFDEYGDELSGKKMLARIKDRGTEDGVCPEDGPGWPKGDGFDYASNHAEPGPRGLVRHKVDGKHCVKQGEGTWDCIVGEFS